MYRWSKLAEDLRPDIAIDNSDNNIYTLAIHDIKFNKIERKDILAQEKISWILRDRSSELIPAPAFTFHDRHATRLFEAAREAIEYKFKDSFFKDVIVKNLPCVKLYKAKNVWAPKVDTVIQFLNNEEADDLFLVHSDDLKIWDPNEVL